MQAHAYTHAHRVFKHAKEYVGRNWEAVHIVCVCLCMCNLWDSVGSWGWRKGLWVPVAYAGTGSCMPCTYPKSTGCPGWSNRTAGRYLRLESLGLYRSEMPL